MTELGEIPQEWNICRVFDIRDKSDKYSFTGGPFGSNLKSCDYTEDGIRVIQLQNIGDGYFSDQYKIYTSQRKADELLSCNIYPGEIILAKMADPVARACIIPNNENRYLMCSDGIRLKIDNNECDNRYIMYSINSEYFRRSAIANSTGSTRLRIGLNELKNLQLIIPPLKEQQKIADILSTVDQQIEQTDALIEKTKELKKGLMQRLLTKGIGHIEFRDTELGRIPKGWEVVPLGKVCTVRSEKYTPSQDEDRQYVALEHIEQETGRLLGIGKSSETSSLKAIFKEGDVLFGKLRPYLKKYYLADFEGVCATEILPIMVNDKCLSKFLFYIVQQEKFINFTVQGSFGTKMPRTSWGEIKEYLIALPSIQEQKDITDVLYMVDTNLEQYQEKKKNLLLVKSGLMDKLLTGRVRVKI